MGLLGRKNSDGKPALLLDVIYVGGHAQWPEPGLKTSTAKIKLGLHGDHLKLKNTSAFRWFKELKILYDEIDDITFLKLDTIAQIEYNDAELGKTMVKLEFHGFTLGGKAKKCEEFRDFLKQNDFAKGFSLASDNPPITDDDSNPLITDDDSLGSWDVFYRGGHPDMMRTDIGVNLSAIKLEVFDDCFKLKPMVASQDWFSGAAIQYKNIIDVQLVQSLGMKKDLKTVIQIDYNDEKHGDIQIRLEMQAVALLNHHVSVAAAKKCAEFEDCLRNNKVRNKFALTEKITKENVGVNEGKNNFSEDVFVKIERLSKLREDGILSEKEFEEKKQELLSQI